VPHGVLRWEAAPDALKALIALFRAATRATGSSVMARLAKILLHADRLPPLANLSRELGVSSRALWIYCRNHLGVGPGHYL